MWLEPSEKEERGRRRNHRGNRADCMGLQIMVKILSSPSRGMEARGAMWSVLQENSDHCTEIDWGWGRSRGHCHNHRDRGENSVGDKKWSRSGLWTYFGGSTHKMVEGV